MKTYSRDEVFKKTLEYFHNDEMAANVWISKYMHDGELTPDDMHQRLAKEFAKVEKQFIDNRDNGIKRLMKKAFMNLAGSQNNDYSDYWHTRKELTEDEIYNLFKNFKYIIPAGSVMSGLGTGNLVSLSNCFVLDSPKDSYSSIMMTRLYQAELMKRRGGVGYDLSNLRPRGAKVNNAAITSTGAASFMDVCSDVTNEVAQQGRRGALMLSMNVKSCDIQEFIEKKQDLTKVTGANVSVQVTDDFMEAVEKDTDYLLQWPIDSVINIPLTEQLNGTSITNLEYNKLYDAVYTDTKHNSIAKPGYIKKVRAKEIWDKIIHCAWNTAEPGIIFKDRMINFAPDGVYPKYKMISTNPCVTGDTLIKTDKGDITIKEIVDKLNNNEIVNVLTYNENTYIEEYNKVTDGALTRKNANIIEIETEFGEKIKLTPDHKVYTENRGYVNASELLIEEDILYGYDYVVHRKEVPNEDVYDITVEKNHNFFANNILVHNCAEIGMGSEEACRLLSINLLNFVLEPFTENARIDWDKLYSVSYEAARLGDDLVELEAEAVSRIIGAVKDDEYAKNLWTKILNKGKNGRRCGLGFTALSDMVASLNLKFCSDEANELVKHVMRFMHEAILDSEIDMAMERGAFPDYDFYTELSGKNEWYTFIEKNFPTRYKKMMYYGRRNISYTTVAPNGSLSIMTQTSSGIEPLFMPYYVRRKKCVNENDRVDFVDKLGVKFSEFMIVHPTLKKFAEYYVSKNGGDISEIDNWKEQEWKEVYEKSPWFNACASDIDWTKRVEVQGICQKWLITHSISSTCNLPNNVTEEKVSEIYINAWKNGLKGITVYRDGCRDGILLKKEEKKEKDKFFTTVNAPKRPKTLPADFYSTKVKGEVFYVIVGLYENKPYETFVYKASKDESTKTYKQHQGTITKIKKGVYNFESDQLKIEDLSSKLSTEELAVVLFSSMLLRTGANIKYIIKTSEKIDSNIASFCAALRRILFKYVKDVEVEGEVCPECGGKLIREAGCIRCKDCSWTRCE